MDSIPHMVQTERTVLLVLPQDLDDLPFSCMLPLSTLGDLGCHRSGQFVLL